MWHATRKLFQYRVPGVREQEKEAPFLLSEWFSTSSQITSFTSLPYHFSFLYVLTVELVAWVFGVGKDSRVYYWIVSDRFQKILVFQSVFIVLIFFKLNTKTGDGKEYVITTYWLIWYTQQFPLQFTRYRTIMQKTKYTH